jgi:hypothetical protein
VNDEVFIATPSSTFENAQVLGITLNAQSTIGGNVNVLTFGGVRDAVFAFPVNSQLYLSILGQITDVAPVFGFNKEIGFQSDTDEIFITIKQTITLA